MAKRVRVVRMSVEQPLWRALTAYRILTMLYAILLAVFGREKYDRPWVAIAFLAVMTVWTLATLPKVAGAAACTKRFLGADLTLALVGILVTPLADFQAQHVDGPTLPSIWTAGSVLAFAIKGGWRWAAFASTFVAVANLIERAEPSRDTLHNVLLVWVASIAIGYVVEVARASERTLARALEIEAATRERERLARDIHDSVLQVLAMVQRRGTAIGGEAAELGRMAGEQEVALRTLVSSGLVPPPGSPRTRPRAPSCGPSRRTTTRPRPRPRPICGPCSPRTPDPGSPSRNPAHRCCSRPRPPGNWRRPSARPWTMSGCTRGRAPGRGSWSRTGRTR